MARIRTIKPEFFRHYKLYAAEQESGMPLRVAFAGLWCCADREGRFKWDPPELGIQCLPYDGIDFSRVLDALASRGFIVQYASQGRHYGHIPGFTRHQVINNREAASQIPEPIEVIQLTDACGTREPRDDHADTGEGKGREGKGREIGGEKSPDYAFAGRIIKINHSQANQWRDAFPRIDLIAELTTADAYYSETPPKGGKWFFPVSQWLKRANEQAGPKPDKPKQTAPGKMTAAQVQELMAYNGSQSASKDFPGDDTGNSAIAKSTPQKTDDRGVQGKVGSSK